MPELHSLFYRINFAKDKEKTCHPKADQVGTFLS